MFIVATEDCKRDKLTIGEAAGKTDEVLVPIPPHQCPTRVDQQAPSSLLRHPGQIPVRFPQIPIAANLSLGP